MSDVDLGENMRAQDWGSGSGAGAGLGWDCYLVRRGYARQKLRTNVKASVREKTVEDVRKSSAPR